MFIVPHMKFLWSMSQIQKNDVYSTRYEFFSIEHVSNSTKRGIDYTHKIVFTFKCRPISAFLSVDGHIDYSQFLAIINKMALNMDLHVSLS